MLDLLGEKLGDTLNREIGQPHFSQYLRRLKKKGGLASCMILFKVEQGRCYNADASGKKVLYDDEPRNMKELLAHPERDEIKKSTKSWTV